MLFSDADHELHRRLHTPPTPVPRPGQVLNLARGDIRWREEEALTVRVRRVRADISGCYDGVAVWLDVEELDDFGVPTCCRQLLVSTAAIARHVRETVLARPTENAH